MKKIYIIYCPIRPEMGYLAADEVCRERCVPVLLPHNLIGHTEEDSIRAKIELLKIADAVLLADQLDELHKSITNRIEIEAASRLHKTILTDTGALSRWLSDLEDPKDELATELIGKNAGARHKARSAFDKLFGGKE